MYKTTARNSKRAHHGDDFYGDLAKIKDALTGATVGVKDRASELLSNSFDGVQRKSAAVQKKVGTYVSRKPFKSVAVAAITGLCVGYLIKK